MTSSHTHSPLFLVSTTSSPTLGPFHQIPVADVPSGHAVTVLEPGRLRSRCGQGHSPCRDAREGPSCVFRLLGALGIRPWAGGRLPPVSAPAFTWLLLCVRVSLLLFSESFTSHLKDLVFKSSPVLRSRRPRAEVPPEAPGEGPPHLFQLLGAPGVHPWTGGRLPPSPRGFSSACCPFSCEDTSY